MMMMMMMMMMMIIMADHYGGSTLYARRRSDKRYRPNSEELDGVERQLSSRQLHLFLALAHVMHNARSQCRQRSFVGR